MILLLAAIISCAANGQVSHNFSDKRVVIGDDVFLPYRRGEVIMPSSDATAAARRIADFIMLCDSINPPRGFKLTFYSEGNTLNLRLDPYLLVDGELFAGAGAQADIWFNDLSPLFRQTLVADIGMQPVKVSEFMGYPVYDNDSQEITVIYKGPESLFIPVSCEEYLKALIADEEKHRIENDNGASDDEVLKEMKKVYQSLLETDKEAAAEFKAEMDSFAAELKQEGSSDDLLTSFIRELEKLTPEERKSRAYYEQEMIGEAGCFSGLADRSSPYASPLVRPNMSISFSDGSVRLIVIHWEPAIAGEGVSSPRLTQSNSCSGYDLADCRLSDLFNDREVWSRVIEMVR